MGLTDPAFSDEAVKAYENWRMSFIQTLDFGPSALPPNYGSYGRTLAIIEAASRSRDPDELDLVKELSRDIIQSHSIWSQSNSFGV